MSHHKTSSEVVAAIPSQQQEQPHTDASMIRLPPGAIKADLAFRNLYNRKLAAAALEEWPELYDDPRFVVSVCAYCGLRTAERLDLVEPVFRFTGPQGAL